jgi:LysM repeat protein
MYHFISRQNLWRGQRIEWKRLRVKRLRGGLVRHSIILAVLLLMGTGVLGGTLFGNAILSTFAADACPKGDQTYRVVWGDTLGTIAGRYKTTVAAIATHNKIANPNLILVNQRICIPANNMLPQNVVLVSRSQYVTLARQFATQAGVSPAIFVKQINQESGFNPKALSGAGAIGIAQFMPATAAGLGINPRDPVQSLRGAANLMARYLKQYGGDYAKALAAYNAGAGSVQNAVRRGGANWQQHLPQETKNYIRVILG